MSIHAPKPGKKQDLIAPMHHFGADAMRRANCSKRCDAGRVLLGRCRLVGWF
jgi:hypothetical protein